MATADKAATARKRWDHAQKDASIRIEWDELDVDTQAALINAKPATSPVPSVRGHTLQTGKGGAWCSCGIYIHGLEWSEESAGNQVRHRHELHRAVVLARRAQAGREAVQPDLFGVANLAVTA